MSALLHGPGFFVFFIFMWCSICALLSFLGGWHSLAQNFRDPKPPVGKKFPLSSMSAGLRWFPINYNSCLTVYLGPGGLRLSVWPIFGIKHPPLLIPWQEITSIQTTQRFFITRYTVRIAKTETTLYFRGKLGKAIQIAWTTMTGPPTLLPNQ